MEVREDQVVSPDGKDSFYGVIIYKDGASVLPLDEKGYVYLNKEFKYALGEDSFETMSGGIEAGELPIDTAKRELQEEYGMTASEWVDLGVVNPFTSVIKSFANMYLARGLSINRKTNHEGVETLEMIHIPFDEALQMVIDSKITHAQSCVLILKAAKYLGKLV